MRIGELAAATGVSVRALRYYEEQGLLTAERSASGQRHYAPATAADRVRLIQQLYGAGLSSRTIVELMPCIEAEEVTDGLIDRLTAERDRIARQVRELTGTLDRLDVAIADASRARHHGVPCPR